MKESLGNCPSVYFSVPANLPCIRVILWLKTPSGRISKFYQSVMVKKMGSLAGLSEKEALIFAEKECIKTAKQVYSKELAKGYQLGEVFLEWNLWE